jgi:hypothetical protein
MDTSIIDNKLSDINKLNTKEMGKDMLTNNSDRIWLEELIELMAKHPKNTHTLLSKNSEPVLNKVNTRGESRRVG